ncbi:3-hydroxyacyl-CoA dehydrogenase family protein [Candidatus Binatia bacterium]|nr:3-hydroxyacyl-CoA dehydrogenase family protein [Candidatus Binatia bacterium]
MAIKIVGVVGAGTIGRGVAQALAETGHRVLLVDVAQSQLQGAVRSIARSVHVFHALRPRSGEPGGVAAADIIDRIECSTDIALLGRADFVVENVTENRAVKQQLYRRLDEICRPEVVFAVNTSAIPIAHNASVTRRAERVVGMHFMNPVPLMPVVEVVRSAATAAETIAAARTLVSQMGKDCVVVADSAGFVTNRVMMLTVNEAIELVQEGVASIEDVDRLFRTCFGHKMGPLETADLIGLDTVLFSLEVLRDELGNAKFEPCRLLRWMVDNGQLGRKTGSGFHHYQQAARAQAGAASGRIE